MALKGELPNYEDDRSELSNSTLLGSDKKGAAVEVVTVGGKAILSLLFRMSVLEAKQRVASVLEGTLYSEACGENHVAVERIKLLHGHTILQNDELLPCSQGERIVLTIVLRPGFCEHLKPELLRAVADNGFEYMSDIQEACIPHAVLGTDVFCLAPSGTGKTAAYILACLQQLDSSEKALKVLVVVPTRENAFAIKREFDRLAKYLEDVKTDMVHFGEPLCKLREMLKTNCPHVLVGTVKRVVQLCLDGYLNLERLTQFVVEFAMFDRRVDELDFLQDVQTIFDHAPKTKQVMLCGARLSVAGRETCKKFMQGRYEIVIH